jgi:hypothetical protein
MRILVDLNHPAHVHLFRNAIQEWQKHGHEVLITARDKDVTQELLRLYGLDFIKTAGVHKGWLAFPLGVMELDRAVWLSVKRFDPDVMVGSSFAIAHISKFIRAKSIVFGEDGIDASRWFWRITRPFADYIVIPDAIPDDFGPNQIKHSSYHELAYLHPNRFSPDKGILEQVGLAPHESFSLVRFVSFGASHDLGESGFYPQLRDRLIKILEAKGRVILNAEGSLPRELEKYRMKIPPNKLHDLISFAKLLVSDSQTMTIEAAALGVPSVRYNSFVGKTPVIEEIESRYQLTYGFRPAQQEEMLEKVKDILGRQDPAIWHDRRQLMLTEKKDLTSWMVKFVETIGKE